jgi:hypothetical protein
MKRKKVEDALEKLVDAQVEWLLENEFKTVGL